MNIIKEDIQNIVQEDLDWKQFNNKTVLITGASGMVGNYITKTFEYLVENRNLNIKLFLLVRNKNKVTKKDFITILEQDVSNKIDIEEKVDYIIHAASPASPLIMETKPVDTFYANVKGAINCLELAREHDSEFIFISSREVYGSPIETHNFTEKDLGIINHFEPRASYSEGKKAVETLSISYENQFNIKIKMLRLAHTYGPGIDIFDGRVQCDFIKNNLQNEDIMLNSDGSSVRTYTYIKDAISGVFYAILKGDDNVYNISNDKEETTILNLAQIVSKVNNKDLKVTFKKDSREASYSPVKYGILDSTKLMNLGWKPQVNIEEGFTRTILYLEDLNNEKN